MNKEKAKARIDLFGQSADMEDFAKRGCQDGMFVSRSQGRRMWSVLEETQARGRKPERLLQLRDAAERGITIDFKDGFEARFYREAYVRSHTGAIDVEVIEGTKLIGGGKGRE